MLDRFDGCKKLGVLGACASQSFQHGGAGPACTWQGGKVLGFSHAACVLSLPVPVGSDEQVLAAA